MARKIVWILFALFALLWSGTAALAAQLLDWGLAHLPLDGQGNLIEQVRQWPLPEWLVLFTDPEAARQLLVGLVSFVQWLTGLLPGLSAWMGALIWIIWGLGLGLLLILAILGHWLAGLLQIPGCPRQGT